MSVDDEVLVNENDKIHPTKVTSVSNFMMQGKYVYKQYYILTMYFSKLYYLFFIW